MLIDGCCTARTVADAAFTDGTVAPPNGMDAVAVLVNSPISISDCSGVQVVSHVTLASGAIPLAGPQATVDGMDWSFTVIWPVVVTLPVLVTTNSNVTTSSSASYVEGVCAFTRLTIVSSGC